MGKKRAGIPRNKLAFWIGACAAITGLLITIGTRVGAFGRADLSNFQVTSTGPGTTPSEAFGLILLTTAFVMFGIAWHLAGKQVEPTKS